MNNFTMNDFLSYEAVYQDTPLPGKYLVLEINKKNGDKQEQTKIEVKDLKVEEGVLICDYEVIDDSLTDQKAVELIMQYLLLDFCDNYYFDKARKVKFTNIVTKFSEIKLHP